MKRAGDLIDPAVLVGDRVVNLALAGDTCVSAEQNGERRGRLHETRLLVELFRAIGSRLKKVEPGHALVILAQELVLAPAEQLADMVGGELGSDHACYGAAGIFWSTVSRPRRNSTGRTPSASPVSV